jgi:hypothetical protein
MVRAVLLVVFLTLSLAACAGDGATTAAAPTEPSTSTTVAEAAGDIVPVDAAPCTLLTADDVNGATGLTAADGREDGPITCVYDIGADAGVAVFVVIEDGQERFSGPASLYAAYVDEGAEMITGLGETAVYSQGFRTIAIDAGGGKFIAVGVNGGYSELAEPRDALVKMASVALGHI